jgi:hypothetical protein
LQGGGEKIKLFSEKTEKIRRKKKCFAPFFEISHTKREKTFSLRKMRKPGKVEKEKKR